jgi:hypothetical protein
MASLMPVAKQQYFIPGTTIPLIGGKLYTYAAGTSTPKTTWQDSAGTIPNTNPITLDSTGSALIYWDGSYKIVLKDALGNTVYTVDNYNTDPLGVAQFITNLASSTGTSLVGYSNGGTKITTEQALDILYYGVANVRNPKYAGGAQGGTHDDTAAFQAAINSGLKIVYVPAGSYTCGTITLPVDVSLIGDGMRQTIINSNAIGASLIMTSNPDGMQVGCIRDLQLVGNNLTGASGNGHAINFIDPAFGAGAFTPQGMTVERVWIRYFRGQESRDHTGADKISSAGIICVEGLQNIYRDVFIHNCGNGFYLERTQTNKIENCTIYLCDKAGLYSYQNVGLTVNQCDFAGNGATGTTDTGYPVTLQMGNIVSGQDEVLIITSTKVKNTSGAAQIYLESSNGVVIENNWLRSDADSSRSIVVNHAVWANKCPAIQVNKNFFSHVLATGTTPASGKPKLVRFSTDYINGVFNGTFRGNTFATQSGLLTEYNLCLEGMTGNTCILSGWDISGNRFGVPLVIGTATVTDVDILVQNCAFNRSRIRNNVFYAQTNMTRTRGISGVNLSDNGYLDIGDNLFQQDGGTISDNYYGFLYPTRRTNGAAFAPGSIAAGGVATTTIAVDNAIVGEPVQAYYSLPLQGLIATGWVSSSGTVTFQLSNPTSGSINPGSGSASVIVSRTTVAEFDA